MKQPRYEIVLRRDDREEFEHGTLARRRWPAPFDHRALRGISAHRTRSAAGPGDVVRCFGSTAGAHYMPSAKRIGSQLRGPAAVILELLDKLKVLDRENQSLRTRHSEELSHTTADADVIRCPNCGAANRVPREKIAMGLQPVCGRCKKPLNGASIPVTVTDATFSAEVEASALPVLLDLWAPCAGRAA